MNQELEKLIEFALADGVITDKEREIIRRKAEKLGDDPDEAEMILDAKLAMKNNDKAIGTPSIPSPPASSVPPTVAAPTPTPPPAVPPPAQKQKSSKVGDIMNCPACGATAKSMELSCNECGHDFNSETNSQKEYRDCIHELEEKLLEAENSISSKELMLYGDSGIYNKKISIINTFTVPNTKESLISFLIFAYSCYESSPSNALNAKSKALKQAWYNKSCLTYKLLKLQDNGDEKTQTILKEYSFLDTQFTEYSSNHQIKNSSSKIGCLGVLLILLIFTSFIFV